MAVDIPAGPALRANRPRALFKIGTGAEFAAMPDGRHFLVERLPERATTTTYVTVTNWFDDLCRKLPVKK
jgi:hypothetical protein